MSSITPKPGMTVEISMQGIEKSRLDAIEAAESLRKANEAERTEAELMRKEGEAGRITAEQERTMEEDARNRAESGRILAEESRVTAENLRSNGEQSRVEAEKGRSIAESGRANAEQQRVESEEMRENAEADRVTAETARANAEALRQQTFEANEANRHTAYESAESARESEWTDIKLNVETSVGSAVASASAATDAANTAAGNANAAAEKSVRYDVAQKISDAQKAQARWNIDAADAESVDALKGEKLDKTPGTWPAWTADEQKAAREKIGVDKAYELIEEITLTEKVTQLIRNAEPNGTAYHFRKMYVNIIIPQAEENGIIFSMFNNTLIGLAMNCITSKWPEGGIAQIYANVVGGLLDGYGVGSPNVSSSSSLIRYVTLRNTPSGIAVIDSMKIQATIDIPINTNIKIYGVRA